MKKKEQLLLQHLRKNSRKSLTEISKETGVPVSTLFDTLKRLEANLITKHFSIVDFSKLGYSIKVNFVLSSKKKKELKAFLVQSQNVNSLSSLINGSDFFAECIFKSLKDMTDFKSQLESFDISDMKEIFIIEDLKREGALLPEN